jgi:hypothetical protein
MLARSPHSRPPLAPTCSTLPPGWPSQHRNDFARLIALELGKPVKDGLGEMDRVADTMRRLRRRGPPDRRRGASGGRLGARRRATPR